MKLTIGKRLSADVSGIAAASALYCRTRDQSGEGNSTFPTGKIPGHYISYNGRVWAGKPRDWKPGDVPVYSP